MLKIFEDLGGSVALRLHHRRMRILPVERGLKIVSEKPSGKMGRRKNRGQGDVLLGRIPPRGERGSHS